MGSGSLFPKQRGGQPLVTEILQQEKPGVDVPSQQFGGYGRMEIEFGEQTERHQFPTKPLRRTVADDLLGNQTVLSAPFASELKAEDC